MGGAITPDGEYILTQEYQPGLHLGYYRISGDQIINIAGFDDTSLKFFPIIPNPFGPDNTIYILYKAKVEIRNISDFSVRKTMQLSGIEYIDFENMNAVGSNVDYIGSNLGYLYNMQTGTMTRELLVSGLTQMIFHSNYLISPGGRKLQLISNN
jgi:hypothetical protein